MPRRTVGNDSAVEEQPQPSTALVLPDDIRADLLRAQQQSIQTPQQLPQVRIMPAGAGLYEFKDNNDTVRSFQGVILNNHPRNVLWDRAFGETPVAAGADDQQNLPACSSVDGKYGTPRRGFLHIMVNDGQTPAEGTELVACATCRYNQWGTGTMLNPRGNPKGKAVTNQRSVYVLMEGRNAPVELILSPTSISAFDEYLTFLTNKGIPAQAVVTEFSQEVKTRAGSNIRWGVATFREVGALDQETFNLVLEKRAQFQSSIAPSSVPTTSQPATVAGDPNESVTDAEIEADEIPF